MQDQNGGIPLKERGMKRMKTEGPNRHPRRSVQLYGSIRQNIQLARMQVKTTKNERITKSKGDLSLKYDEHKESKTPSIAANRTKRMSEQQRINQLKLSRVINALHKQTQSNDQKSQATFKASRIKRQVRGQEKYEYMMLEYHKMMQEGGSKNLDLLIPFVKTLASINGFLSKLEPMVYIPLFQMSKIKIVPENKILYENGDPCKTFFLILWGEFKLKNPNSKQVKYCISGDTLREQVILQPNQEIDRRGASISELHGGNICKETCKSVVISGVLEIKKSKYEKIRKQLAFEGEKDKFNLMDKMLMWGYMKKSKLRK